MRLVWLRSALQNLQQEAEFIAEENPAAAAALVRAVRAATKHLADFPETGRPDASLARANWCWKATPT